MYLWVGVILLLINLYGFCIMGIDKNRAKSGKYRISEKALWITAFCGGAVGVTIGMNLFRHKTKHNGFRRGLPALVALQLVLLYFLTK